MYFVQCFSLCGCVTVIFSTGGSWVCACSNASFTHDSTVHHCFDATGKLYHMSEMDPKPTLEDVLYLTGVMCDMVWSMKSWSAAYWNQKNKHRQHTTWRLVLLTEICVCWTCCKARECISATVSTDNGVLNKRVTQQLKFKMHDSNPWWSHADWWFISESLNVPVMFFFIIIFMVDAYIFIL